MEGVLRALLALCLVTGAHSAPVPATVGGAGHFELISEAIDNYNKGSDSKSVFLLLVDEDRGEAEPPGVGNEVKFVIKETLCQKSENKTSDRCQFKSGGVEKRCRASIKESQFTVSCHSITDGTNESGGSVEHSSDRERGDPAGHQRTVIIEDKGANPHGGEEEMSPEDEDDDDYPPDTVIQFHDDHRNDEAGSLPQGETRGLFHGNLLGRLLCLRCIIDIFPRK